MTFGRFAQGFYMSSRTLSLSLLPESLRYNLREVRKTEAKPSRVPSQSDWLLRASIMILLCA